ncbi:hypothetical protein ACTWQJ_13910, partial [Streptomyces sp. KR55]
VGSVQPDRLAEFLLVAACDEEDDLLTRIVSAAAHCGDPGQAAYFAAHPDQGDAPAFNQMMALREAVRAARSQAGFGNPVRPLLDQIERTASRPVISDETLAWTVANVRTLPSSGRRQMVEEHADGSRTITSVLDEASAALEVAGHRRNAHAFAGRDERQQGFVHMMHSLSLSQLGRPEEALELSVRAAECFRSAPGSEAELAMELHRQARLLLELGRNDGAVEVLREEVRLRTADEPALRTALDVLILTLCRAGRFAEARPYARQEIELLGRSATGDDPGTARSYLISLGRYLEILCDTGDLAEAPDCCTRAETFLTRLPASVLDELAAERALFADARARALSDAGDQAGGVAAWLESAELWQRLDGPYQQYDPVVRAVMGLNNAGVGHAALGDRAAAVAVLREALELALGERGEPLRRTRPELYEQVHATCVGYLVGVGRLEDALREAERLWDRPAPSSTPLPPHFANSLRETALAFARRRRLGEATRASRIAVGTLEALDPPADDHHLSLLLATTLADHAANLAETGEHTEGAETAARAVRIWRRLCAGQPGLRINWATALANQAMCLHLDARHTDAAHAFGQAAQVLREVTRDSPQDRPMLADMLASQGACHSEAGDHTAAALARTEEAMLRSELWETDPSTGPRVARAHTELALVLQKIDRLPEALAAAKQALGIYHHLYGSEPGGNWPEVARALMVCGTTLLKSGRAAEAVAPFLNACSMALAGGDRDMADSCQSAIDLARAVDPAGVSAEMRRLLG